MLFVAGTLRPHLPEQADAVLVFDKPIKSIELETIELGVANAYKLSLMGRGSAHMS